MAVIQTKLEFAATHDFSGVPNEDIVQYHLT